MRKATENFNDTVARLFPDPDQERRVRTVTMQVTDGCNLRCSYCLSGDTLVTMADRTDKPIRDIQAGEKVLGFSESRMRPEWLRTAEVRQTFRHRESLLLQIDLESMRQLKITPNHKVVAGSRANGPFQFLEAKSLTVGQYLFASLEGRADRIISINPVYGDTDVYNLETETGTYVANGIAVHNCYQINKGNHFMDFDLAKRFIDLLLAGKNPYINLENTSGLILDFIGGEPLLAIGLMRQITEYTLDKMITEKHPWLPFFRISICSNGTLYFQPEFQEYLRQYATWISFSVSIDGNRELHDACRVFADGRGSYDIASAAALHYMKHFGIMGTKMTLAPGNVAYTADAIWNLLNLGYQDIHVNCVYEEGWTAEHATTLYNQMKILSDALLRTGKAFDDIYIRFYDEDDFEPMGPDAEDKNWCGGNGEMLAVDYKGNLYPCLRYMESSLGDDVPPVVIGTVDGGLEATEEQRHWVQCLQCMTRTSQSTEECKNCPIARGCSWCSAMNYQVFKCLNKRATFICVMHKAQALANVYFWNKYYRAQGDKKRKKCNVPREWALEIIPEAEYDMLLELAKED